MKVIKYSMSFAVAANEHLYKVIAIRQLPDKAIRM